MQLSFTPPPVRRPWLPLKHVIGLLAVLVFIVGGLGAGWVVIDARGAQVDAEHTALEASQGEDIFVSMSIAMLEDDRERFIGWGDGPARDQLARIWDETKEIGWTHGMADSIVDEVHTLQEYQDDPQRYTPDGIAFSFDLGFPQTRLGGDADCAGDASRCGLLTQQFEYDVAFDDSGGSGSYRIQELSPRNPMPWDAEVGVHAVHSGSSVLFGYADEAARLDAAAAEVDLAAAGVLQTELATSGYLEAPGLPAFLSDDPERYRAAVHGSGDHFEAPEQEWEAAGYAIPYPKLSAAHEAARHPAAEDLLIGGGANGGALATLNGARLREPGSALRTAAHEFTHVLDFSAFERILGAGEGPGVGGNFGAEGFAAYTEDLVASPHDGRTTTTRPEIRELVVSSTDEELEAMIVNETWNSTESPEDAYDLSGNYYAFLADSGFSITEFVSRGKYNNHPPLTAISGLQTHVVSGEDVHIDVNDWRAWNAMGEGS